MNILITGFEAFLKNSSNPTEEVLKLLPNTYKNHNLIKIKLPVVFNESFNILKDSIDKFEPKIIINLGLAADRLKITPERISINIDDSVHPDNESNKPIDQIIDTNGKNALFSTLPIKAIVKKLNEKDIASSISNTAGTYVCNNLMYNVLNYIDHNDLNIKAGFIHVPKVNDEFTIETLKDAIEIIINECIIV